MAGSVAIVADKVTTPHLLDAAENNWNISFSRFVSYPSLPSTCASLIPLPKNRRSRPTTGTWISSESSSVTLQLLDDEASSGVTISISLENDMLVEEHSVSKLHFSWPHVSCFPGYPARGIRAVFASYKDSSGEIQKFAMRFRTFIEAMSFINVLKDVFKIPLETKPLNTDFESDVSFQSMFDPIPTSSHLSQEKNTTCPIPMYSPHLPFCCNVGEQDSSAIAMAATGSKETVSSPFPPSFTTFLANICSDTKPSSLPNSSDAKDLKSQIMRYMEDDSFQDMLVKVQKIIYELGEDFPLTES